MHTKIREHLVTLLLVHLKSSPIPIENLEIALGGSTSIDIYPRGWNKTYALKHVDEDNTFFVGDKCHGSGNDRHIYERVKEKGMGAYCVLHPANTLQVIREKILPILGETNG